MNKAIQQALYKPYHKKTFVIEYTDKWNDQDFTMEYAYNAQEALQQCRDHLMGTGYRRIDNIEEQTL